MTKAFILEPGGHNIDNSIKLNEGIN